MCFSPEASFGASAVLAATGVWTLSATSTPAERPLAAIPMLFSVQQFAEGLVWVGLLNDEPTLTVIFGYVFSFFALFFWPILVPLATARVETSPGRRRIQEGLLVVGLCVAVMITGSLARHPLDIRIVNGHIAYHVKLPLLYESLGLYFVAVSAPCFSSHRYLRIFGVLLLVSLAIALASNVLEFISVWCFFAALLSVVIVLHLREARRPLAFTP